MDNKNVQRLPAEQLFQNEIDALIANEKNPIPTGWRMSPSQYLLISAEELAGAWRLRQNILDIKD